MKKFAFGFACVLAGCAAGAVMPHVTAQTFAPNPAAPRWQQTCVIRDVGSLAEQGGWLAEESARRGNEGWELIGFAYVPGATPRTTACFKRPAPQ